MKDFIDAFYDFLDRIGYLHPIHPAMVHMPIGLVVGATAFIVISAFPRFSKFRMSGHHALTLALIFWFPTVLFGILDWQRNLGGAWLFVIKMKFALAAALLVFLAAGVVLGYRGKTALKVLAPIYAMCFALVLVLGYFGGKLVYSGLAPAGPAIYQAGQKVFDKNCTGCHAHGGNVIAPDVPLAGAPQLANFGDFEQFIRNPRMPNGTTGVMPPFTASQISEQEAKALHDYIVNVIVKPARNN
jgi:mono/diheme cytochrome c family protein